MRTTFVLSGTPESYSATDRDNIKWTIADAATVPYSAVEISLTAASTRVEATITLIDRATAAAAMATLSVGILASAASLQSALAANGVTTNVLAPPTLTLGVATVSPPPSAAPSPPPPVTTGASAALSSEGSPAAIIIAVAIVAALLLAATAALLLRRARRARAKAPGGVVEATEAVVSKHGQSSISVDEIELASPSRNARKEARLHHWKIEPGELEWEIGRELGRGAFGSVFKVYYNDQPYAAKKMDVGVGARERHAGERLAAQP